jgi:regulator of replication initiation timing
VEKICPIIIIFIINPGNWLKKVKKLIKNMNQKQITTTISLEQYKLYKGSGHQFKQLMQLGYDSINLRKDFNQYKQSIGDHIMKLQGRLTGEVERSNDLIIENDHLKKRLAIIEHELEEHKKEEKQEAGKSVS